VEAISGYWFGKVTHKVSILDKARFCLAVDLDKLWVSRTWAR
jgi:hypothetical protein